MQSELLVAKRQAQALPFVAEAQVPVTVPGSPSVFKNICCVDECGYVACSRIRLSIRFQSPSEFPSGFLRICSALLYGEKLDPMTRVRRLTSVRLEEHIHNRLCRVMG